MKKYLGVLAGLLVAVSARAEVRVFVEDNEGVAWIRYECTGGEIVRAFALDVTVDRGQIVGVSDFFRGPSTAGATGYGIFPASLRDHLLIPNTEIDWNDYDYSPLANPADVPEDTLPGLGSSGVTLEFGGLWEPATPAAVPKGSGILCALELSEAATVSIAPNSVRGGVVSAISAGPFSPVFEGATVGPAITNTTFQNGTVRILFKGGELQTAPAIDGPWIGTGDFSGSHAEPFDPNQARFYRVRSP